MRRRPEYDMRHHGYDEAGIIRELSHPETWLAKLIERMRELAASTDSPGSFGELRKFTHPQLP